MGSRVALLFVDAPRWLLLFVLLYAPWAHACTTPETIRWLNLLLLGVLILWLLSRCLRVSKGMRVFVSPTRLHPVPVACVAILLAAGWWMAWNAHHYYDPFLFRFFPVRPIIRWLPGSVDARASTDAMIRLSLLLGTLLYVADLSRRPNWRVRILATLGIAGGSIAILGIAFKLGLDPAPFWNRENYSWNNFATFRYHANAAAFLNLVIPVCAILALRAFRTPLRSAQRALWIPTTVLLYVSAAINPSRAGQFITVALSIPLLWIAAIHLYRITPRGLTRAAALLTGTLVLLALIATAAVIGWEKGGSRWQDFARTDHLSSTRIVVDRVCLEMIGKNGPAGFGPGTFRMAFPLFTHDLGDSIRGSWRYAHMDYLQTAVEWGIFAIPWAILLFGGLFATLPAIWYEMLPDDRSGPPHLSRLRIGRSRHRLLYAAVALALLGVSVHAAVDFPLQIASIQLYTCALLGVTWALHEAHPVAPGRASDDEDR